MTCFMHVCSGRGMPHGRSGPLQGREEERETIALILGVEQNREISVAIQSQSSEIAGALFLREMISRSFQCHLRRLSDWL